MATGCRVGAAAALAEVWQRDGFAGDVRRLCKEGVRERPGRANGGAPFFGSAWVAQGCVLTIAEGERGRGRHMDLCAGSRRTRSRQEGTATVFAWCVFDTITHPSYSSRCEATGTARTAANMHTLTRSSCPRSSSGRSAHRQRQMFDNLGIQCSFRGPLQTNAEHARSSIAMSISDQVESIFLRSNRGSMTFAATAAPPARLVHTHGRGGGAPPRRRTRRGVDAHRGARGRAVRAAPHQRGGARPRRHRDWQLGHHAGRARVVYRGEHLGTRHRGGAQRAAGRRGRRGRRGRGDARAPARDVPEWRA